MPIFMIIVDHLFQNSNNSFIESFSLTLTLGVIRCGEGILNVITIVQSPDMLILKICTIVRYNFVQNAKPTNDMNINKVDNLWTNGRYKWFKLDPLSKTFYCNDYKHMDTRRWRKKLSNKIKHKGLYIMNGIKCLHSKMLQMRMLLVLNIFLDIFLIIFFHYWPILPHSKDMLSNECTIFFISSFI